MATNNQPFNSAFTGSDDASLSASAFVAKEREAGRALKQLRRQLARLLMLRGALFGGMAGAVGGGLYLLAARVAGWHGNLYSRLLLLCAVTLPVAFLASLPALRRLPRPAALLALLDDTAAAGGLLMSRELEGAAAWPPVTLANLPRFSWRGGRQTTSLALALSFALLAALLPNELFTTLLPPQAQGVKALTAALSEQIATVEREELLPTPAVEAIKKELERLSESGRADDPARTLEALDHLDEELAREATGMADKLDEERATLEGINTIVEQLQEQYGELQGNDALAAATAALNELLTQAALPEGLLQQLLGEGAETLGNEGVAMLDRESLAKLAKLLKEAAEAAKASMERLQEMELIDARGMKLESCDNAGACDSNIMLLTDQEMPTAAATAELLALLANCAGGSGGISRGGGPTPLTWGDPSSAEGVSFKDEALVAASKLQGQQAHLVGRSAAAPETPDVAVATQAGALQDGAYRRGTTPQSAILPRHRGTVARYFE